MDISTWNELAEVFKSLTATYGSAVELGKRKHEALVMVDMGSLSKILDEEQLLIARIQRLEKKRGALLTQMAQSEPSITSETKMEDFIRLAPTRELEAQLSELHRELSKNVAETIRLRDNNQILAQGALDAVKYHLNRLSNASMDNTYSNKGGVGVNHKNNFNYKA